MSTSTQVRPSRPIGGFRGGLLGFSAGFVAASLGSYFYLIDDYRKSNESIATTVASVSKESVELGKKFSRIDALEDDFDSLKSSIKDEIDLKSQRTQSEVQQLQSEVSDLRTYIVSLEQDISRYFASNRDQYIRI
ncbi:hypothetical protein WALSEDRAFT_70173 [Wallemia mellicola CBS 633.66]|uniref:Uncharacterized protein n=1 Tax=Wallemia mellicola (strain ATCC MYA-4683 / CBS 633.66) TaxID=671144 RepID=I4Y7S0_WALMC|nr:hypothetical protein WALSEDRAFT_70173 [Wallemia mellicola CBS 633.66]EIM20012.1 hypothetical protein WALSEDRAFT_70173 [Wallemia mellicola CBS 633.66]TIC09920.1 hypothetical protein E3Q15_03291 [Wallemia mellicola]TIC52264.1 hypothetical protein E3Q05_02792 [Wallemia mellicola]|eukprot:XP_006959942.1 hypothetical protein WALSEDRAFT_70173 [Wallemia mellicola CBS 633.66]